MRRRIPTLSLMLLAVGLAGAAPHTAVAGNDPGLGAAEAFAVLGASTVTNTGTTSIGGALGVAPGTALTGFSASTVNNPAARAAQADLGSAYVNAASQACPGGNNLTGVNLGGQTLGPGVYCQSTAPTLTGTLVLSGSGVYIFQIGSTLITATGANVVLTGGAQPCQVYWQVGSSATISTGTNFIGTIMALAAITMQTGAALQGRALARTAAVTLDTNRISRPGGCSYPAPLIPSLPAPPAPAPPQSVAGTAPLGRDPASSAPPVADSAPLPGAVGVGGALPAGSLAPASDTAADPRAGGIYQSERPRPGRQRLPIAVESGGAACQGPDCGSHLCPVLAPAPLESGCVLAARLSALVGLAATGQPVVALVAGMSIFLVGAVLVRRRRAIERPSD